MLASKTLKGIAWAVLSRVGSRGLDLLTLVVLARVLDATDFGVVAFAGAFIAVVDMILEVPLIQALTRLTHIHKSHLDTAFTLAFVRGAVIAIIMTLAAVFVAYLYGDFRLAPIMIVLSTGSIARCLYSPGLVFFFRRLDFKVSFTIELTGKIVAAILSLVFVLQGYGYWAIVVNQISSAIVPTVMSYYFAPYRPKFSFERIADFAAFTGWFTSSQILSAVGWQYDRLLLGFNVKPAILGHYTMASDFSVLPSQSLIGPAMRPIMTAFSLISLERERLIAAFMKAANLTLLIAAPIGVGIALTSDQIVAIVLGRQWSEMAGYLTWLSLSVVFSIYNQPVNALCLAVNKPAMTFRISCFDTLCKVLLGLPAFYMLGVPGLLYSRLIVSCLTFFNGLLVVRLLLKVSITSQIENLWKVGMSCILMSLAVILCRSFVIFSQFDSISGILIISTIGASVFVCCMFSFGFRMAMLRSN